MKYFGWVLLLELVCIASPLRADTTGTMCGLLPPRNHKDHFPFFRVWRVRKEWDRCSPQVSNRMSQSAAGTRSSTTGRDSSTLNYQWVSVVASESTSEQMWQSTEQVEPGKNAEQELLFSISYSHSLGIQNLHWTCFPYMKIWHFFSKAERVTSCSSIEQYSSFQTNNYNI